MKEIHHSSSFFDTVKIENLIYNFGFCAGASAQNELVFYYYSILNYNRNLRFFRAEISNLLEICNMIQFNLKF